MTDTDIMPRHSDMIIKVCGMRDRDNVRYVASLTPMLMGFIFYDKSPRSAIGIDPAVIGELPEYIRPVAVFVNASTDEITAVTDRYGFKIVQLHGDEPPEMCDTLRNRGLTVFKAVGISSAEDLDRAKAYDGHADLLVLDTKTASRGGSGLKFSWDLLKDYRCPTPYLLSGGIGPGDVDAIVGAMRPGMAGIDINSRFETAPGVKDVAALTKFILSLRKFNEDESIAKPFWEKTK